MSDIFGSQPNFGKASATNQYRHGSEAVIDHDYFPRTRWQSSMELETTNIRTHLIPWRLDLK